MLKRIILAGAATAALSAPAFAEWNVIKPTTPPAGAEEICMVVERAATPGEAQVSGPFATEEEGMAAAAADATCKQNPDSGPSDNSSTTPPG